MRKGRGILRRGRGSMAHSSWNTEVAGGGGSGGVVYAGEGGCTSEHEGEERGRMMTTLASRARPAALAGPNGPLGRAGREEKRGGG